MVGAQDGDATTPELVTNRCFRAFRLGSGDTLTGRARFTEIAVKADATADPGALDLTPALASARDITVAIVTDMAVIILNLATTFAPTQPRAILFITRDAFAILAHGAAAIQTATAGGFTIAVELHHATIAICVAVTSIAAFSVLLACPVRFGFGWRGLLRERRKGRRRHADNGLLLALGFRWRCHRARATRRGRRSRRWSDGANLTASLRVRALAPTRRGEHTY